MKASRFMLGALAACWAASALAQPLADDPSAPKTREQVRYDLRAWLAAGYDPNDWIHYPENAMRAGRIVAQRRADGPPMTQ
ncbi:conserved exported hypothetical protein [Burkholderia sp. 8Y]|uniref:DUF4148 domain-containing protein n=1 Tax=Burkholderia sp. 8Y TaxID=2653133 RepID=UPI0012F0B751|nr:DUF4148 domain-containing protein [Burkholderia sp. 8Y]VXB18937.1 conserved exported hypothetical protein [Burkholderia sp. 8Y]